LAIPVTGGHRRGSSRPRGSGDGVYSAAATTLPYEDADGLIKYFAVDDSRGRVFVFSVAVDALLELEPRVCNEPPITALLVYLSPRHTSSSSSPAMPTAPSLPTASSSRLIICFRCTFVVK
ncbi:Os02g0690000, partial [Oryza sativa Japonica Group]